MSDSLTLPLRPIAEKREHTDLLPVHIAQISSQWGSFRDVSEDTLRAGIESARQRALEPATTAEGNTEGMELDATERLEQLYKRRGEITQFALQAHMETMFALDFVSLLLSKYTPRQAETSISAYLKQVAPLGTLNAEIVNPPPRPDSVGTDIRTVSRGWRLQSFNSASQKLLRSATRLEDEVTSETRYWNEILAVKENGWKVCRLPRERQALGVQFGFLEAISIFRDRGFATLRRAADGRLVLDTGLVPATARRVRVEIKRDGRVVGRDKPSARLGEGADTIEARILRARDALFEEELFHELAREARIMASQGVTTRQNLIQVPVGEGQEVVIDLVNNEKPLEHQDKDLDSHECDTLADGLAHAIRILLAYAHRLNLRRRTQTPPPLTQKKKHSLEHRLLRPVLAYLQHHSHVNWLQSFVSDIVEVIRKAGMTCTVTAAPFSDQTSSPVHWSDSQVEHLLEQLLRLIESRFSVKLITSHSSLDVKLRTDLFMPPFGTNYDISINMPRYPDVQPPSRLGLRDEVAETITHLIMLDVVSAIATCPSLEKKAAVGDGCSVAGAGLFWKPSYAHHGELLAPSKTGGATRKLKVVLSRDELTMKIQNVGAQRGDMSEGATDAAQSVITHTWKRNAAEQPESVPKTWTEFLAEASKE